MFLFEYFNYIKFQRVGKTFFQILKIKSSRPEVFSEKGVPKNSAKFTDKHLSLSLFLDSVAGCSLPCLSSSANEDRCYI